MQKEEIIKFLEDTEDVLMDTAGLDQDTTEQLLEEYAIHCWALKHINDSYPLEQAIRFQEICDEIERQLPNVSDKIFDEYCIYCQLLAICLESVPRKE